MTNGRLGPWQPTTTEERLDRLDSLAAIGQLPARYGAAVDSRDIEALAALFSPEIRMGTGEQGRNAIRSWFDEALRGPRTSIHFVANHVIDFVDADHATGIVYCRDELERPETGEWQVGTIQYWDTYERIAGEWCFARRVFHRWYIVDALSRPAHGAGVNTNDGGEPLFARQLPEAYPTWDAFWDTPRA